MTGLRDTIVAVLHEEFRPSADIARRAGVDATQAAPALGRLRQPGVVERMQHGTRSLWRLRRPATRPQVTPGALPSSWWDD